MRLRSIALISHAVGAATKQPMAALAGFFWGLAGCVGGILLMVLLLLGGVAVIVL